MKHEDKEMDVREQLVRQGNVPHIPKKIPPPPPSTQKTKEQHFVPSRPAGKKSE